MIALCCNVLPLSPFLISQSSGAGLNCHTNAEGHIKCSLAKLDLPLFFVEEFDPLLQLNANAESYRTRSRSYALLDESEIV